MARLGHCNENPGHEPMVNMDVEFANMYLYYVSIYKVSLLLVFNTSDDYSIKINRTWIRKCLLRLLALNLVLMS